MAELGRHGGQARTRNRLGVIASFASDEELLAEAGQVLLEVLRDPNARPEQRLRAATTLLEFRAAQRPEEGAQSAGALEVPVEDQVHPETFWRSFSSSGSRASGSRTRSSGRR